MEEVESLVGNANHRKRLGDINGISRKKKSGNFDAVAACANNCNRSDLMAKLVVAACVLLLGLLYMSTQSEGDVGIKDIELKNHIPAEVPSADENVSSPFSTPSPVAVPTMEEKEKQPTQPEPVEKATPPPTPATVVENHPQEDESSNEKEENVDQDEEKPENNDAYLYSKYATILPLIDHPLPDEEEKNALAEKYGKWHFWDGDEDERPMEDYAGKFPNRDIPGEEIHDEAWQADAVYVNHILNDADLLIARAMEAIFIEYGHGKPLEPEGTYLISSFYFKTNFRQRHTISPNRIVCCYINIEIILNNFFFLLGTLQQ